MKKSLKFVLSFLVAILLLAVGTTTTQAKSKHRSKALVTFKQTNVKTDKYGTFILSGSQKKGVTITFNGKTVDLLPDQNGQFKTSIKAKKLPKKIKVVAKKNGVKKVTKRTILINSKAVKTTTSTSTQTDSSMSAFQTTSLLNHTDPNASMTAVDNSDSAMNESSTSTTDTTGNRSGSASSTNSKAVQQNSSDSKKP